MADQEGVCKSGEFIVVSLTPDMCWTPVGSTVVPVPYMITADLSDSLATSPDTRFNGQPVFLHDKSKISHVTGDEAGTASGVKSGTYKGIVESIQGSSMVRVNGKPVVRHGDPCKMNTGNTMGRVIYQGPGGGAPNTSGDTNPPVVPKTPEEEQAAREKRGLWALISDEVHTGLDMAGFIPGVGIKAEAMAAKAGKQVAEKAAKEAAEKGTKEAGEKIGKDGVHITPRRMKWHKVECFKAGKKIPKDKHAEFDRQLQRQEDALNRMTVDEYFKGREAYQRLGRRAKNTQAARRDEQAKLAKSLTEDYHKQGMSPMQAEKMANARSSEIMKGMAALHEPDLSAGGKDVIGGFGDAQVNKSIGAGWRSRVGGLDEAAGEVSTAERGKTQSTTMD